MRLYTCVNKIYACIYTWISFWSFIKEDHVHMQLYTSFEKHQIATVYTLSKNKKYEKEHLKIIAQKCKITPCKKTKCNFSVYLFSKEKREKEMELLDFTFFQGKERWNLTF